MSTESVGPDDRPVDDGDIFCFIDASRPCRPECMAHSVFPPEGKDYEGKQWARCMLLSNAHKIGKHVVHIASKAEGILISADSLLKFLRVKKADDARGPLPSPPRGG